MFLSAVVKMLQGPTLFFVFFCSMTHRVANKNPARFKNSFMCRSTHALSNPVIRRLDTIIWYDLKYYVFHAEMPFLT